jgi:hypothetical protein
MSQRGYTVLMSAGSYGFGPYGNNALHHPEELRYIALAEPL